jgi:hypothetical protein
MYKTDSSSLQFPPFPHDIIQGAAKSFVELYAPIRETPSAFLWLSFVTYFGNAISPYIHLDCESSEPRFFGVAIGKSGRTRKSAGNNAARDLFKAIKKEGTTQNIIEGFGSAEGLLSTLERGNENEHSPTTIHLDEINVLASKTDIKGSAGIAIFHKLFEDHDYDHPLANGRGSSVRNAFLSLIGASTLEDFTKTWSVKHEDAGFFSRLLLVGGDVGEKRISRPQNPDPEQLTRLVREVHSCIAKLP